MKFASMLGLVLSTSFVVAQNPATLNGSKEIPPAKAKIAPKVEEKDSIEEEMVQYEIAKIEYHGWIELSLTRGFFKDSESAKNKGKEAEAYKLLTIAKERLRDIITRYPDSQAAEDAKLMVAGKTVEVRPSPAYPKLPKSVVAKEIDIRKELPHVPAVPSAPSSRSFPTVAPSIQSSGPVFVRGYTRKDGTYVRPHYRKR